MRRRNIMEHFDAETIEDYLNDALTDDNSNFEDTFLKDDNQSLVRDILEWASDREYFSFSVSSPYILNELSRKYMASRILFFWEKIRQAWRNKSHKLKKRNLLRSHEEILPILLSA